VERGAESGVGDMTINALYSPYTYQGQGSFFRVTVQGGIKMPTGDSERLAEELEHPEGGISEPGHEIHEEHEEIGPLAVHGHDLALGSGSWDLIGGANFFGQYDLWIAAGSVQYTYRTEGDYDYRYADLLIWDLGVGRYLYVSEEGTVAFRMNLLGEAKGMDQMNGSEVVDTGITSMFYGPEVNFTVGEKFFGLLALDLPAFVDNTGTMLVQDYRFRMAVMYRF
jgi:hypothetical protein